MASHPVSAARLWSAIVLAGIGTYLVRVVLLAAARRVAEVPRAVQPFLAAIPPAVLAGLVLPALVRPEETFDLTQPRLVAGAIAAAVGVRTGNVLATLGTGMLALLLLEWTVA